MNFQPQLDLLKEATALLGNLATQCEDSFSAHEGKDIRRSFINRHAWNVHDIATDILTLGEHGDLRSIYLLSRPALESLFTLAAAVMTPSFAAEKIVAEVQAERDRVKEWLQSKPIWRDVLEPIEAGLREYEQDLRSRYGVVGEKRWKPYKVAEEGKLRGEYVSDYFVGSKHVHSTLSALVDRESALYIPAGICGMTLTVAHTSALLSKALADIEKIYRPEVLEIASDISKRAKATFAKIQLFEGTSPQPVESPCRGRAPLENQRGKIQTRATT